MTACPSAVPFEKREARAAHAQWTNYRVRTSLSTLGGGGGGEGRGIYLKSVLKILVPGAIFVGYIAGVIGGVNIIYAIHMSYICNVFK